MKFPVYLHLFGFSLHPHLVFESLAYTFGFLTFKKIKGRWVGPVSNIMKTDRGSLNYGAARFGLRLSRFSRNILMKMGDVIAGFISGLMVWLVVFILVAFVGGGLFHISSVAIEFVTALLLAVLAIALVGKIRKSALVAGLVIALAIGTFVCARSGPFDPKLETAKR
jgi:hypothetical protein